MGSGESEVTQIRFAPYIEEHHHEFLNIVQTYRDFVLDSNAWHNSPYYGVADKDFDSMFFGAGIAATAYPTLYDMYGKFIAGLDIEVLFNEALEDTINGPVVTAVIEAEAGILNDDLQENSYPRFETGMRDINSVMSSTFVIGRALMESNKTRTLSRFSAELRGKLLPLANDRWGRHLEWNRSVVDMYSQMIKFYIITDMDSQNMNLEVKAKNELWPFNLFNYEAMALGTLQGAKDVKTDVAGASGAQRAIGGALSGAAAGAMVGSAFGPGPGTAIGAAVGGLVGLVGGLF
jgi:hypothetical protein